MQFIFGQLPAFFSWNLLIMFFKAAGGNKTKIAHICKSLISRLKTVLNRNIINKIDGKSYLDMTEFLEKELDDGGVSAFPVHEYWLDIGRMEEYERSNQDIVTIFNQQN